MTTTNVPSKSVNPRTFRWFLPCAAAIVVLAGCKSEPPTSSPQATSAVPSSKRPPLELEVTSTEATRFQVDGDYLAVLALEAHAGDLRVEASPQGLRVTEVAPGSAASRMGLSPGDIITRIADTNVTRLDDVAVAYAAIRKSERFDVHLLRSGAPVVVHYAIQPVLRRTPREVSPRPAASSRRSGLAPEDVAEGITKTDDTHFRITREVFEKVWRDDGLWAKSARIIPAYEDGKPVGFKLYGIRSKSLLGLLGVKNGDQVERVNGQPLDSPEAVLRFRSKANAHTRFEVDILRRGERIKMIYEIVDGPTRMRK